MNSRALRRCEGVSGRSEDPAIQAGAHSDGTIVRVTNQQVKPAPR
jgi:hypothetical protein